MDPKPSIKDAWLAVLGQSGVLREWSHARAFASKLQRLNLAPECLSEVIEASEEGVTEFMLCVKKFGLPLEPLQGLALRKTVTKLASEGCSSPHSV